MSDNHKIDAGLIGVILLSILYASAFGFINAAKFNIFSSTTFGWQFIHIYPKIAYGRSPFELFILPEYAFIFFILTPINFIFAHIYGLILKPQALLWFQSSFMSIGAVFVYLLSRGIVKSRILSFALSVAYLLHPVVTTGSLLGYMPLAIGLLFLLGMFLSLEKGSIFWFSIFLVLSNAAKIDVVVINLLFSLVLYFLRGQKKFARVAFFICASWLIIIAVLVLLYLSIAKKDFPFGLLHLGQYNDNFLLVLNSIKADPLAVLRNIFNPFNMLPSVFFGFPFIFAFLSPLRLIPLIPETLFLLLRNHHSTGHFMLLAFTIYAGLFGIKKFLDFLTGIIPRRNAVTAEVRYALLANLFAVIVLVKVCFLHYLCLPKSTFAGGDLEIPFNRDFSLGSLVETQHVSIGKEMLKKIPPGAACLTMQSLAPHLSQCGSLGDLSNWLIKDDVSWEYIFLDLSRDDFYPVSRAEFIPRLKGLMNNSGYTTLDFKDSWIILQKCVGTVNNERVLQYLERIYP